MVCGQSEVIKGFALEIPINDGGGQFNGAVDCLHLGLIALSESENFACFWGGDFVPSNVEPDLPLMFIRQVNRLDENHVIPMEKVKHGAGYLNTTTRARGPCGFSQGRGVEVDRGVYRRHRMTMLKPFEQGWIAMENLSKYESGLEGLNAGLARLG